MESVGNRKGFFLVFKLRLCPLIPVIAGYYIRAGAFRLQHRVVCHERILLLLLLRALRRTSEMLRRCADRLEAYLDSARNDTTEFVERTLAGARRLTREMQLKNGIRFLSFLTVALTFILIYISSRNTANVIFFSDQVDMWVLLISFLMIIANILYFAWQTLLYFRYKPIPPVAEEALPECTVIVPAYNEGRQIALALESILNSDYPKEKLSVIAVNDGSRDDTWEWIRRSAEESAGRILALNLKTNMGKRKAIYQALLHSRSEIFVTIDSDSEVLASTLRNLVSPFVADPKIGGVAGSIRVLNLDDGALPRMLDVNFVFSFDFIRSAQSVVRSVMCTPGALSAYRRSALDPFLQEWAEQTFLGQPANIGEDRAITNILLREGHEVVFQSTAVAFTEMPTTYIPLCKMFIRWARSNIRENLAMLEFAFRKIDLRNENLLGMQLNLIMQSIWMFTPLFFLSSTLYCLSLDTPTFLYTVFLVIAIWSTFPSFIYACKYNKKESIWAYVFGFFNFIALSWIGPYSLLTVHKSGWLTREIREEETRIPTTESVTEEIKEVHYPFLPGEKTCPCNMKKP